MSWKFEIVCAKNRPYIVNIPEDHCLKFFIEISNNGLVKLKDTCWKNKTPSTLHHFKKILFPLTIIQCWNQMLYYHLRIKPLYILVFGNWWLNDLRTKQQRLKKTTLRFRQITTKTRLKKQKVYTRSSPGILKFPLKLLATTDDSTNTPNTKTVWALCALSPDPALCFVRRETNCQEYITQKKRYWTY